MQSLRCRVESLIINGISLKTVDINFPLGPRRKFQWKSDLITLEGGGLASERRNVSLAAVSTQTVRTAELANQPTERRLASS